MQRVLTFIHSFQIIPPQLSTQNEMTNVSITMIPAKLIWKANIHNLRHIFFFNWVVSPQKTSKQT